MIELRQNNFSTMSFAVRGFMGQLTFHLAKINFPFKSKFCEISLREKNSMEIIDFKTKFILNSF